jgi:hypothetical protein
MTDPNNCGSVGNPVPPSGYLHANWSCVNGQVVMTSCVSGYFNANGSTVDGCEWQQDVFEPNDTQATARNMGNVQLGGSVTVNPNLTPNNADWFKATSTGCTIFPLVLCNTKVSVTGFFGTVFIQRDDGPTVGNGQTESSSEVHSYFVEVIGGGYSLYQIHYENN